MPTGYTAAVEDGTITDLPTFALRCARAFGALIMMREEPADAPIPEDPPFEPSSYHTDSLARAEKRLLALLEMTAGQVEAECDAVYKRRVQEAAEDVAQLKVKNDRYRAMRQKVEAWTPPSSEHEGLKRFMLEELDSSVYTYIPTPPERILPAVWLATEIASVERDILYHPAQIEKDRKAHEERSKWVRDLRKSL
jgi:hypothetical protein